MGSDFVVFFCHMNVLWQHTRKFCFWERRFHNRWAFLCGPLARSFCKVKFFLLFMLPKIFLLNYLWLTFIFYRGTPGFGTHLSQMANLISVDAANPTGEPELDATNPTGKTRETLTVGVVASSDVFLSCMFSSNCHFFFARKAFYFSLCLQTSLQNGRESIQGSIRNCKAKS